MRAAVLFAPHVSRKHFQRFRNAGVEFVDSRLAEADVALIFGGDGAIHRHLPELVRLKIPMLAVPTGSGNDFAQSLGITSVAVALSAWNRFCAGSGTLRDVDLGRITRPTQQEEEDGIYFCAVAGAGLDADANRRANRMPPWLRRHGGYLVAAIQAVAAARPAQMAVREDGEGAAPGASGPAWFVAIANTPRYGDGMRIAPEAKLEDGLLDVCFVGHCSKLRLLKSLPKVFSGSHVHMREVKTFRGKDLRLEAEPPLPIYADGEPAGFTPVTICVLPRALRVIMP